MLKFVKKNKEILLILIVASFLRSFSLKNILVADETFTYFMPFTTTLFFYHPPLFLFVQKMLVLQGAVWTARLAPFLFGVANIFLVYVISLKLFNKKTALFFSALMTLSFWHILASSMVDINGGIVMFEYLLAFFFFINYLKTEKMSSLFLTSLVVGLTSITKYADFTILIFILCLIHLYEKKDILKLIKFGAVLAITSTVIFGLFTLWAYFFGYWNQYLSTTGHITDSLVGKGYTFRPFMILTLWATPLLFGLAIFSLFMPEKRKTYFVIWSLSVFLLYFFTIKSNALPYERYLMTMIPALCVLGGRFLATHAFERNSLKIGGFSFAISYFIILFLNLKENIFIEHLTSNYVLAIKSFNLHFMFPYVGSSGSSFWVSFDSMIFAIGLGAIFLLLYLTFYYCGKEKLANVYLVLSIGILLAFNVFLIQEHSFSLTNPSIDKVSYDIILFYNSQNLSNNVFVTGYFKSLQVYLTNATIFTFNKKDVSEILTEFKTNNDSVVLFIDFPTTDKSSELWAELKKCDNIYTSSDKGEEIGFIFSCKKYK